MYEVSGVLKLGMEVLVIKKTPVASHECGNHTFWCVLKKLHKKNN